MDTKPQAPQTVQECEFLENNTRVCHTTDVSARGRKMFCTTHKELIEANRKTRPERSERPEHQENPKPRFNLKNQVRDLHVRLARLEDIVNQKVEVRTLPKNQQ